MAYIIWKDNFNIGVIEMDNQHKLLVGHINNLYDSIQFGNTESSVVDTLAKMTDYIKKHFTDEEKFLKSINYPNLDVQIKQHANFISEIASFKNTYMNKSQTAQNMLLFLKDWFLHHIATEDLKYAQFTN